MDDLLGDNDGIAACFFCDGDGNGGSLTAMMKIGPTGENRSGKIGRFMLSGRRPPVMPFVGCHLCRAVYNPCDIFEIDRLLMPDGYDQPTELMGIAKGPAREDLYLAIVAGLTAGQVIDVCRLNIGTDLQRGQMIRPQTCSAEINVNHAWPAADNIRP